MNAWTVLLAAGIGSYLMRMSMIGSDRLRLPPRLDESVDLVAPAAFAALGVTSLAGLLLAAGPAQGPAAGPVPVIGAVIVSVLTVARTDRPSLAIVTGMPTVWLLAALTS